MDTSSYHISIDAAAKLLEKENARFVQVMKDGNMKVEYFAPKHLDRQQPHHQDELYIIIAGETEFLRDGETMKCSQGNVIFVPAKMEHRFMNFSEDFATWVIFYGEEVS
ncbi:MAG: cupin domain-containing protein [Ginsengibacter sp.]